MANIMNCAGGGTAAAGTGSGNLPYTPAKLEILDNFISKLTPKPRETDRGPPLTDRIETRPLPTATWTALPDPDVGITAIVEGAEAVLVASQKLHFLIQRELHLELFCDSEIYSITYQKCREGQIPAWVIGGTGVLATNGVSNNPRADPLDEFIDKLTPSDEQDEDEVEQRIDTSTIENHPPIVWKAPPWGLHHHRDLQLGPLQARGTDPSRPNQGAHGKERHPDHYESRADPRRQASPRPSSSFDLLDQPLRRAFAWSSFLGPIRQWSASISRR